jgi:hypothetical protein
LTGLSNANVVGDQPQPIIQHEVKA